jgi:chorismate mutase
MEISELRQRIDELDGKLVRLLNERAAIANKLGLAKRNSGHSIHDLQREDSVIKAAVSANSGPLSDQAIRKIFVDIVEACREIQTYDI